ncbi:MAG: hypothetical protein QOD49_49 [Actinomycetota bacterium]|nr:hypothetical protein [Actinomycetota bacterium]
MTTASDLARSTDGRLREKQLATPGERSATSMRGMRRARTVLSATDSEAATVALSDAYTDLSVQVPRGHVPFQMQLQYLELSNVSVSRLNLVTSTLRTQAFPCYALGLPGRGRVRCTANRMSSTIAGHQAITFSPGSQVLVEYLQDDCEVHTIMFDRGALERELLMMLGRSVSSPIRFDFSLDLDACGSSFPRALTMLRNELAGPDGTTEHPLITTRLERLVMAGLLVHQRHNYSDELRQRTAFEGPKAIRIAIAAIEEHAAEFTTVADIAFASNLSMRALERGFRQHLGVSPMRYLRDVRMARAHDELASSDPDAVTATVVAHNWGFAHYGRFAAGYRQTYGCTPSETLRKSTAA